MMWMGIVCWRRLGRIGGLRRFVRERIVLVGRVGLEGWLGCCRGRILGLIGWDLRCNFGRIFGLIRCLVVGRFGLYFVIGF